MLLRENGTYSIPEIIFSYSSHQGIWLSFFAFSNSCMFFSFAAMVVCFALRGAPDAEGESIFYRIDP